MTEFALVRLEPDSRRKPFDCDHDDLNDFFFNDSKVYARQLYAVTYALEMPGATAAFFSVSNDSIRKEDTSKSKFKRIIPYLKHGYESHPAVKIVRLGVSKAFQKQGVGTMVMDYIKGWFIDKNKTGCRFILVDSYQTAIEFYKKNGFNFLTSEDALEETRLMYYDLIKFRS